MLLKHGQWVKFEAEADRFADAHRGLDGKVVGIYQASSYDNVGRFQPAHVAVVKTDGTDAGYYPSVDNAMKRLELADWLHDVPESRMFPHVSTAIDVF